MGTLSRKRYPGRSDINAQFTAGKNIRKALADYKQIKNRDGDYQFGALTETFYQLNQSEKETWESDLRTYPKDVQDEIKRHIIHALTHLDHDGNEKPIPLTIKWSTGAKAVAVTYNPSAPSYKIEIFGFPAPAASPFAGRREKKKSY